MLVNQWLVLLPIGDGKLGDWCLLPIGASKSSFGACKSGLVLLSIGASKLGVGAPSSWC